VEPSRVEEAIAPSSYVAQGIVVGQDRKTLACLVVPRADEIEKRIPDTKGLSAAALADRADVLALVKEDLTRRTGAGSGLKPFEVVNRVALLPEPLSLDNGCMTATLKPKRHEIVKRFADRIEAAYQ
jgi:long-chain acyl-CoA synthetase